MTTTQARLAETIETFYGAADRTSDGAMASHAFKSAVEELDSGIQRELVRGSVFCDCFSFCVDFSSGAGYSLSRDYHGAPREDERLFPCRQRAYHEAEQEGETFPPRFPSD